MPPGVSVYLDVVRFAAALVVFAGHLSGARFTGGFLWQFGPYMAPAVSLFFVLSGFVIGVVTRERERDVRTYAINRLARMYSVALPAVVLTVLLDAIGRRIAPELFSASWGYTAEHPWMQVIRALTFTQKSFGQDLSLGSDLPYWSLDCEVFYYLCFGVAAFCPGRWLRGAMMLCLACFSGPLILLLLPLWVVGFAAARLEFWRSLGRVAGWCLVVGSVVLFAVIDAWSAWHGRVLATLGPVYRPELVQDYLVAVLFVAQLTGVQAIAPALSGVAVRLRNPVRMLADRTFSLYLFHLPVAQFLAAINPLPPAHVLSRVLIFGGTLVLVLVLAQYTELQKAKWRAFFRWLIAERTTAE